MSIKVTQTKMHTVPAKFARIGEKNGSDEEGYEVPVSEGKLVLVECPIPSMSKPDYILVTHKPNESFTIGYKPIIISETEKIEVGDWVLRPDGIILQMTHNNYVNYLDSQSNATKKILALPQHFSSRQLDEIMSGRWKDGDKVLVECDTLESLPPQYCVSFHPNVTLHKVEEKMYTETQLKTAFNAGKKRCKASGYGSWDTWRTFQDFMSGKAYEGNGYEKRNNGLNKT